MLRKTIIALATAGAFVASGTLATSPAWAFRGGFGGHGGFGGFHGRGFHGHGFYGRGFAPGFAPYAYGYAPYWYGDGYAPYYGYAPYGCAEDKIYGPVC